jgi:hypothetical protein
MENILDRHQNNQFIVFFVAYIDRSKKLKLTGTVKPVLRTTSEQGPPVNNGQSGAAMTRLDLSYH